jgi:hypothetical protein
MKMEQGVTETSAYKIQTPGITQKKTYVQRTEQGESLKSRKTKCAWLPPQNL